MKEFWDDLFFNKKVLKLTDNDFAEMGGKEIREDLDAIEYEIRQHNGKGALELIDELKARY